VLKGVEYEQHRMRGDLIMGAFFTWISVYLLTFTTAGVLSKRETEGNEKVKKRIQLIVSICQLTSILAIFKAIFVIINYKY